MKMNYKEEIQSLRGFAVLLVVLFHFFPDLMPRGYLGVDIFFVISGYLMSKIISKNIIKKEFNIKNFYLSRFRRLFPSLLVVILIISIISIFILLPIDIYNLFESIKYTFLFIPNFYFWSNGGYFGLVDELKPFLHLWSIGVEFQFYFTIPIIYLVFTRYFKIEKIHYFLIFLFLLSYSLNIFLDSIDGKNFSFFMYFTRLWEFLIGSFFFHFIKKKYYKNDYIIFISIFIFSFILIKGFSIEILNKSLTVLFALIIIFFRPTNYLTKIIVNQRILIFFGLISYTLYLWHWPIISLAKYYSIIEINLITKIILILFSILLATLTTKFLENKFRFELNRKYNHVFNILLVILILTTSLQNNHNLNKIDKKVLDISSSVGSNYRCETNDFIIYGKSKACLINTSIKKMKQNKDYIALYGNSHAQMYGYAFEKILQDLNKNGIIIPLNACLPTYDLNISELCLKKAKTNLQEVLNDERIKTVIIGLNYNHRKLIDNSGKSYQKNIELKLISSLQELIKKFIANNKKIILIGPISIPSYNFPLDYSRNIFFKKNLKFPNNTLLEKFLEKNYIFLKSFETNKNLRFFLPHNTQCNEKYCEYIIDNQSLFADDNHLSKYGAEIMKDGLKKEIIFLSK